MQGALPKNKVDAGAARRAAGWALMLAALAGCSQDQELSVQLGAPSAAFATSESKPAVLAREVDFKSAPHSSDAAMLVRWVRRTNDNRGHPFAVIDKRNARLFVFFGSGELSGATPILLGSAKGDDTAPGVGDKAIADVLPSERTTPAGRFVGEHGSNARKEDIIWIDYNAAVSMHPVLTTNPKEHRLERLASQDPEVRRISYGCVNVPKDFFANVLQKTLSDPTPIVYVLPETRQLYNVFAGAAEDASGVSEYAASRQHDLLAQLRGRGWNAMRSRVLGEAIQVKGVDGEGRPVDGLFDARTLAEVDTYSRG